MSDTTDPKSSTPVPDPTVLTTQQLIREMGKQDETIEKEFAALEKLINERFRSVDQQLQLVERQRVEQKSDTKAAVDAALTAQKDAVKEQTTATDKAIEKTEKGTNEQLKQITLNFTAGMANLQEILNDIKDRVVKLESIRTGNAESKQDYRAITAILVSVGVLAIAGIGLILSLTIGR